ncbi:rhotekin-like [Heptranchias perlo]|uniref:rhotekin-like n=1 Tax=Heptranchias perlo TaxID=212740 RepID=UPI00355A28FC
MDQTIRIMEDLNLLYIRQIALSLQDTDFQKKIDYEIRMRDGTCKLLAACTQREQALEAAKSLLTCNTRIMAYMAELQKMKEAQILQRRVRRASDAGMLEDRLPCSGTVAITDLRIPLMWKDTDYFKNKGDSHRYAVFCLLQIGCDIYDTEMVIADRTMTDICFQTGFVFSSVGPDFALKVEIYSCCVEADFSITSVPKKLVSKLTTSLGRCDGRKVRAALESSADFRAANGATSPISLPAPSVPYVRYHSAARSVLNLSHLARIFPTTDVRLTGLEDSSFWLPLYGSMCCRLAAQPQCMTQHVISSSLNLQMVGELYNWTRMYCVLQGTHLFCYYSPEEVDAKVEAAFTIAINKETRIRATDKDPKSKINSISITNRYAGEEVSHTLVADSGEEKQRWLETFWQHLYDMSEWKQCCDELMNIEIASPRKPPVMISNQGSSLYQQMAIDPPDEIEPVTDILSLRVQGHGHGHGLPPPWFVLFENTQKTVCRNLVPCLEAGVMADRDLVQSSQITNQPLQNCSAKDWNSEDIPKLTGDDHTARYRTLSFDAKLTSLKCEAQTAEAVCLSRKPHSPVRAPPNPN